MTFLAEAVLRRRNIKTETFNTFLRKLLSNVQYQQIEAF